MEGVEEVIQLLHKRRATRRKEYARMEKQQIAESNELMNTLKCIKDKSNNYEENIIKNLQCLTTNKHSIDKLVHSSENIPGLPISHKYHSLGTAFLTEGIDFINKLHNMYKYNNSKNNENIMNYTNFNHDVTSCIKSVETALYETKSLLDKVKTFQRNVDVLQKYLCTEDSDM